MRMSEARDCFDFLQEPLGAERCGDVGIENLNGDIAIVPGIASTINGSHAASAELTLYGIAVT
jgi:hypothetical protein